MVRPLAGISRYNISTRILRCDTATDINLITATAKSRYDTVTGVLRYDIATWISRYDTTTVIPRYDISTSILRCDNVTEIKLQYSNYCFMI